MGDEVYKKTLSLYNQMKLRKMDPDQIQEFFDQNKIPINIKKQTGLENVLRTGGSSLNLYSSATNDYFFGEADMSKFEYDHSYNSKQYHIYQFLETITGSSKTGIKAYVYKEGEKYPRELKYDKSTKTMSLSEPMNVALRAPAKPTRWMKFANKVFGGYKQEFKDYKKALKDYEEKKKFFDNPAAERQKKWREKNQDLITKQSVHDEVMKENTYKNVVFDISRSLDNIYSPIEKTDPTFFNRIDYIMINGRTVKSLLMEDYLMKYKNSDGSVNFKGNAEVEFNNIPEEELRERTAKLIFRAHIEGKPVKYMKLNDSTGEIIPNGDGGSLHTLEVPKAISSIMNNDTDINSLKRVTEQEFSVGLQGSDNPQDRLALAENTVQAMQAHNLYSRINMKSSISSSMKNQLFTGWARKNNFKSVPEGFKTLPVIRGFSVDRSCLSSHAVAYLITEGYSLEDINDPAKFQKEKAAAGEKTINAYLNKDFKWMSKVNIDATKKLIDQFDEKMSKVDFKDNKSLFTKENENLLGALNTMHDLQQERDFMTEEALSVIAEEEKLDISKPEELKKAQEKYDEYSNTTQLLAYIRTVTEGYDTASKLSMGTNYQLSSSFGTAFSGEAMRDIISKSLASGKSIKEYADLNFANIASSSGTMIPSEEKAKYKNEDGPFRQLTEADSVTKVMAAGSAFVNGSMRKNFNMSFDMNGDKEEVTFEKKQPHIPAHEENAPENSVKKDGQIEKSEVIIASNK